MQTARDQRAERDEAIRAQRAQDEAAAEETADEIGDRVERPAHLIPTTTGQEAIRVSGFKFEEAAAEMENAARTYEPDGNMEVLAMIDNLPMALLSIANTFRILAERSDEEFAFEKDVAAGFDDIHATLLNAVDAAETLVPLFRSVHEADIARHEDPRNGTQAEKGWNV
jgi:molecular chaperone GrpE (heat shock protein)